jgi:hypothetical protein
MTKPLSEILPEMEQEFTEHRDSGRSLYYAGQALRLIRALKRAHALIEKWRGEAKCAEAEGDYDGAHICNAVADELSRALDEEGGKE